MPRLFKTMGMTGRSYARRKGYRPFEAVAWGNLTGVGVPRARNHTQKDRGWVKYIERRAGAKSERRMVDRGSGSLWLTWLRRAGRRRIREDSTPIYSIRSRPGDLNVYTVRVNRGRRETLGRSREHQSQKGMRGHDVHDTHTRGIFAVFRRRFNKLRLPKVFPGTLHLFPHLVSRYGAKRSTPAPSLKSSVTRTPRKSISPDAPNSPLRSRASRIHCLETRRVKSG